VFMHRLFLYLRFEIVTVLKVESTIDFKESQVMSASLFLLPSVKGPVCCRFLISIGSILT
jgi:hypothetical protein